MDRPVISVCIPTHNMDNGDFFLKRCLDSLKTQEYKNFEVIITADGKMAENTNSAIKKAKGDIIKILFMDDYLAHDGALKEVAENFKGGWLATGCSHDDGERVYNPHVPKWNKLIHLGNNTIGSPSVIAFENKDPVLFDEKLSWMIDCDWYKRLFDKYGKPTLIDDINVVMGLGSHQTTHKMSDEEKKEEVKYVKKKHEKSN